MEYIDSHAHTNFDVFDEDREEVYARARQAGLVAIVEVGVGLEGSRRAVSRANEVAMVHAAAGLHPTDLDEFDAQWPAFEELARGGGIIAVGECGLDYYWMKAEKRLQERAFRAQIALARELGLPFIVHCREADDDLIRILADAGYTRGVVHCFGGTAAQAEALLDLGMHISFCGNVTYRKNDAIREAARAVPLDRLLLETDSPFLAPGKRRGKRNEPAFVVETARYLASLHEVAPEQLVASATSNTKRLFAL